MGTLGNVPILESSNTKMGNPSSKTSPRCILCLLSAFSIKLCIDSMYFNQTTLSFFAVGALHICNNEDQTEAQHIRGKQ